MVFPGKFQSPVILVAEDDEEDFEFIREAFLEYCVDEDLARVHDGEELLAYLKSTGPYAGSSPNRRPGIILLDLNLPGTDGRQALRQIRSDPQWRQIPVIVLTGSDAPEDLCEVYALGVNSYIKKPTYPHCFIDVMKVFTRYWEEIKKFPEAKGGAC